MRSLRSIGIPVLFGAGIFFSCKNEMEEIQAISQDKEIPIQTTYNGEFFYTQEGKLQNKLIAAKMENYEGDDPYYVASGGFELFIYDTAEVEEAKITAEYGAFYQLENKMFARNNVKLFNVEGEELHTEELTWLQDSDKVYTDKFVKIIRHDGVIYGRNLVSNLSFSKYQMDRISGDIYIQETADSTKETKTDE